MKSNENRLCAPANGRGKLTWQTRLQHLLLYYVLFLP